MKTNRLLLALAISTASAGAAFAAAIAPSSYDMPNGDGTASGGSWNYWDATYNGAGNKTVDGAPLTGGTGKLTDGLVASGRWETSANLAGTGAHVGWYAGHTLRPTITFHFAGNPTIDQISIQLDNSGYGGVNAPAAILIDGTSRAFTPPAFGDWGIVDITGLSLTGATHTVELDQSVGWVFVSEISFSGRDGVVPEPGALGLLGIGLAGLAFSRRRRPSHT